MSITIAPFTSSCQHNWRWFKTSDR